MTDEHKDELDSELGELQLLVPQAPNYGFSLVHDRVFVTWFDAVPVDDNEYQFVSEPMSLELTEDEARDFHDLMNAQMDQMQALLEGFVQGRKDAHAMDDRAGLETEVKHECENCGAFKPDPNKACVFC